MAASLHDMIQWEYEAKTWMINHPLLLIASIVLPLLLFYWRW